MELTIKINQRTKEAKALIDYLLNLPFIEVETKKSEPNKTTINAIKEVEQGKTQKVSLEDFRKKLYS